MSSLRIIFFGTPEFAVPSLEALLAAGEEVVAVVTQPDRPKGRGRKLCPPPVKVLAESHRIPVLQPTKVRTPEFVESLAAFKPDLGLVTAYGRILVQDVLDLPTYGCINVHGSLLPKYRGAAPVQWAVLNDEEIAGVTIMQMDAGLDTGDILLPGSVAVSADDTSATLAVKLAKLGGELLVEALARLRRGELDPIKQDDSQATLAPLLKKEDSPIDWQRGARQISAQIRGLDPWPLASTTYQGKRLRLFRPQVVSEEAQAAPGTIIKADKKGLLIATGDGCLLVQEIQRDGSRRMAVASFLQGHKISCGDILA